MTTMSFYRACAAIELCLAVFVSHGLRAQTYVQVAELDPNNPIGPRITSTVTQANLQGRTLFGWVGDKVTYVNAMENPATAYQFASDAAWNRILFGKKDLYIHGLSESPVGIPFLGPAGIDYGRGLVQGLPVYIADRANERVVVVTFDAAYKQLVGGYFTPPDSDLSGLADVAFDGAASGSDPSTWYFYTISVNGRIAYWNVQPYLLANKNWSYGSSGSVTGQFMAPKGICVGHALGPSGGSVYTTDFYVTDGGNGRLVWLRYGPSGPTWMGSVSLPNGGKPLSCAVDHFGNVTVADSLNSKLVKYTWNLLYLDSYGTYGTGSTNDNTLAHPHAVDVPFGPKSDPTYGWVWFGDGRVITAEDWGSQSGAREHYLGMNGSITTQPGTNAQFSYFITDHGSQVVTVVNSGGTAVRTLLNDALDPPGAWTLSWDGNTSQGQLAPTGNYTFKVVATSAYSCSGQAWCAKTLVTTTFFHQGPPQPSISGPSNVQEFTTHTWTGSASAGIAPYSYQWTVDGAPAGTGTSITEGGSWAGGESHAIVLTVTDAAGRVGGTELDVYVFFGGGCIQPPCPPEELSVGAGSSIRRRVAGRFEGFEVLAASWNRWWNKTGSSHPRRAPETSCSPRSESWCSLRPRRIDIGLFSQLD